MRALLVVSIVLLLEACTNGCKDGAPSPAASASISASSASSAPSSNANAPPLGAADLGAASDAVVAYYAALAAKDCTTLPKLVDPPLSNEDCKKAVDDAQAHMSDFDRVVKSVPDGRDPTVALVTVRLASGKGPQEQVVRVKKVGGAWRIVP